MPLRLRVAGHVEAVLREASPHTEGLLREEVERALGDGDAVDSDDSLVAQEPSHITWASLQKCWKMIGSKQGSGGVPQHLHEVIASTQVYHRDPAVRWRLENPDRKAAYKKNQEIRKNGQAFEYRRMTENVDVEAKEQKRFTAVMKEGMTMPMDFLMLLLLAVPAAYMVAKMSSREHWGWVFAAVAAAGIVLVEGILITIRLSKVDGWLTSEYSDSAPERARLMKALRKGGGRAAAGSGNTLPETSNKKDEGPEADVVEATAVRKDDTLKARSKPKGT